ncbi:tRNA (adenosine(37)-N6)-threonylcarbamoyltransferase complex ATPase subunit type 1 TsaE [Carboxylicivirga sp. M1479]|uniref:tRNA (adenosine(37)-N6)-threonylcarbamoyltransferase complex ATPase subunit type 1 TsaE n=1 Tax=Carboxylicivirga sp. M1479 TaxID=2594476 RepID=UPI00117799C1|nr:tRNA (adenosine(37)-N6)-threonylcarbamoyltransferase complex ATPase subunit type 1 TsaE [Carboxylicivirga sp. M1479]TRX62369.1 tRNA (adenosine(37)-N6)-threonylcarbamoyltransferase complex ATPase subunit type 1 TsaE [Carboxylicivirga sp. M1479]
MDTFHIDSLDNIGAVAAEFLANYKDERVLAFYGPMGVGKTTFVKALCQELKVEDTVNSPSFAIVNEYRTFEDETVYHFDFYRLKEEEEAYDMGYEDYLYSGCYSMIEWPEKIASLLPEGRLELFIEELEDGSRKITVEKR